MRRAGPSWVLALVCVSAGAVAAQLIPDLPLPPLGDLLPVPPPTTSVEEFEGFLERIGEWGEVKDIVDEVTERWEKRLGRKMTPEELDNFFNVKHFNDGFDAAVKGGHVGKTEWLVENLKLGLDAYIQAGDIVYNPDLLGGPVTINNNTPPTPMKVESIVATPANTDAQRQGFWARLFGW